MSTGPPVCKPRGRGEEKVENLYSVRAKAQAVRTKKRKKSGGQALSSIVNLNCDVTMGGERGSHHRVTRLEGKRQSMRKNTRGKVTKASGDPIRKQPPNQEINAESHLGCIEGKGALKGTADRERQQYKPGTVCVVNRLIRGRVI